MKSAKPEQKLNLWIMEHFQVLPTDERYTLLSIGQKEVLFLNFLISPTDKEYRANYPRTRAPDIPDEILEALHYNPDEIKEIKKVLYNG